MMGCAPCHSVNRPRSARCSAPDTIVRKWFPASNPALLPNCVRPYGIRISVSLTPPGYRRISPGRGYVVAFSGGTPIDKSPSGTHVDSPLQRTCSRFCWNGSISRNAAHVCGAFSVSSLAVNRYGPAVTMRSDMRPHKRPAGLGGDLAVEENGLAAAHRPNNDAGELKPEIRAHFMPLQQVLGSQRIRTRRIEQHQIRI